VRRTAPLGGVLLCALTIGSAASAQDPTRVAAATVLFDEAIRDMEAGRLAEACPKLVKSQELAPSGGTLLALGDCHLRAGKLTSAWLAFREAASRAAAAGKGDAEQDALNRAKAVEARLPRLTVIAPSPPPAGLEVQRDGTVLNPNELGIATPIDPGKHEIRATVPGLREPWTRTVDAVEGTPLTVTIPASLESTKHEQPPTNPVPQESSGSSTQKTIGLVVAGVGVASIAVGSVFGILAMNANDEALEPANCRTSTRCTPRGLELTETADNRALVSTILFAAGGAALIGGAILFFTAPSASKPTAKLRFTPVFTGRAGGAAARIDW